MTNESLPHRLLTFCFTKQELQFLHTDPRFIEATRNLATARLQLRAVDVGQELIRENA